MGRKIPFWQCALTLGFTAVALMYALGILGMIFGDAFACDYGEAHIPLIASCVFATVVAILNGYKWSFIQAGILAAIHRSMQANLILMTTGILIAAWGAAGVVPSMIYYGLMILKPTIFLSASAILCFIVALSTGSSWSTVGTIGIALIGIGSGLGFPSAMTAGAIVSGAYCGDKMSPLSDTTNLAPAMAGANIFEHIRHMMWTVIPSMGIALILYTILGLRAAGDYNGEVIREMQKALTLNFNMTPILLIPPVIVILIVAFKLPALPGLMGGAIIGCIFGMVFNGMSMGDLPSILHYGYNVGAFSDGIQQTATSMGMSLNDLLGMDNGEFSALAAAQNLPSSVIAEYNVVNLIDGKGGLDSMLWTVSLVICAMCYGGVMDASGMLVQFTERLLKLAKNTGMLVTVTVFTAIMVNVVAGDQILSIVITGRMYKEAYEDRRLRPKNLSRCLEDSATVTSNLVPWNTCGATMRSFMGVPQWGAGGYGPYAFLSLFNPIISIFYGFTGISMEKMTEEEYQKVLEQREKEKTDALNALKA